VLKTVIFDMHGVILRDPDGKFMPYVRRAFPQKTEEEVFPLWDEAECGRFTSHEFLRLVGYGGDLAEIERNYLDTLEMDGEFPPCAAALREKFRLALLSDDISEWSAYIRHKFALNELFDEIVISGDAGVKKPSPEIYRLMLEKLGQPAAECVFIDDRRRNLAAAAGLGMGTVYFNRRGLEYAGKSVTSFKNLVEFSL